MSSDQHRYSRFQEWVNFNDPDNLNSTFVTPEQEQAGIQKRKDLAERTNTEINEE